MTRLYVVMVVMVFLIAFMFAVIYRDVISDWLMSVVTRL